MLRPSEHPLTHSQYESPHPNPLSQCNTYGEMVLGEFNGTIKESKLAERRGRGTYSARAITDSGVAPSTKPRRSKRSLDKSAERT